MSCYFTLFYCLLDPSCGECNVIALYFLCCVFMNGLVKPFAILFDCYLVVVCLPRHVKGMVRLQFSDLFT